ncbi:MAG: RHS repeat protein [Chitinophagaceae bacterium]|nr:MAG: RHS repeat protein [Chitinophagaceae bacterium]
MGSQIYDYVNIPLIWGRDSTSPPPDRAGFIYAGKIIYGPGPDNVASFFCYPTFWGSVLVGSHYGTHGANDGTPLTSIWCNYKAPTYRVARTLLPPPATSCSGNPIDNSNGVKIQLETDIESSGLGKVAFQRYFNSGKSITDLPWHFTYERNLIMLNPDAFLPKVVKSKSYRDKSEACGVGWGDIKGGGSESWGPNATTQFVGDKCQVLDNGKVITVIPVILEPAKNYAGIHVPVQLVRDDGSSFAFQQDEQGNYYGVNDAPGVFSYVHIGNVEWRYINSNNEIEEYSEDGKLLSITTLSGLKQAFTYNGPNGLLSQVQDLMGHKLTFTYASNQIRSVTTEDNKTTSYTYNAAGVITDVKRPDNTHRIYHYEDSRFPTYLTGITDERGIRYATWKYDAQGRAISSEHAGGAEKTLLAFNIDGSTTVTNALNKQTIYRFEEVGGARRVSSVEGQPTASCVGANQNYTYMPNGLVASKTDWKGNKTTYTYNTKGQEISRIEAFGTPISKTINTEWHAILNLKTKMTEPDRETIYTYDANGLLIGQKIRSVVTP